MPNSSEALDSEVLRLRTAGRSFPRISRELDLNSATEAHSAFKRAVQRLPVDERDQVRQAELLRLDRLTEKVTADRSRSADQQARQLATIERLRALVAEEN